MLSAHLKARGFSSASLVALRILTEGIEGGLSTVLLAFYNALHDARHEWQDRR